MRSRLTVALLSLGLMVGGTGGVIAAKGGNGNGGAAKSQYKPGIGPCKNGGTTPSGTHTGAPGNGQDCANKPGQGGGSQPGNGNGPGGNSSASNGKGGNGK